MLNVRIYSCGSRLPAVDVSAKAGHSDAKKFQKIFLGTTATTGQGALIDDIYIAQGVNLLLPKALGVAKGTLVRFY